MPAAIVFEGELTGKAGRVLASGVDDCTERRGERRAKSKTDYKPLTSICVKHVRTVIC